MAGPFEEYLRLPPIAPGPANPTNPRAHPSRPNLVVGTEVRRAAAQRDDLLATMTATGQADALVIARLEGLSVSARGACTSTTWSEGPTTVLPLADVVVLFELPKTIDAEPQVTHVRWDVLARVCGAGCWRLVPGLDPQRVITRRWPDDQELEVLRGLSLPAPGSGGPTRLPG